MVAQICSSHKACDKDDTMMVHNDIHWSQRRFYFLYVLTMRACFQAILVNLP